MKRTLMLTAAALLAACSTDPEAAEPLPPQPPLAAPLAADLEPTPAAPGCQPAEVPERWRYDYTEAGRLRSAVGVRDGAPVSVELEFDAADRVVGARESTADGHARGFALTYEADQLAGYVETRDGDTLREVTIERAPDAIVLHHRGELPIAPIGFAAPAFDLADFPVLAEASFSAELLVEAVVAAYPDDASLTPHLVDASFTERRTFDAAGRRVETRIDDWAGTNLEIVESVTYAAGEVVRELRFGGALVRVTRTQGPAGAPTQEAVDTDADGVPDRVTHWIRAAGAEHAEIDEDADGTIEHRTSIFFDADGHRILKYEDDGLDLRFEWRKRYVYDAAGRRVYEARDQHADGDVDERWDYDYDAAGRLLEERRTDPRGHCGAKW